MRRIIQRNHWARLCSIGENLTIFDTQLDIFYCGVCRSVNYQVRNEKLQIRWFRVVF